MLLLLQISLTDERSWPLLGMAGLALAYVVLRPMLRRKRDPLESKPSFSSMAQQRAVERQMQNLLVDLTEMARQISGQLDTRATKLELLLREADEKIAQLRSVGQNASPPADHPIDSSVSLSSTVRPEAAPLMPVSVAAPLDESESRHAEVYALADAGRAAREIAAELGRPRGEIELILALRPRQEAR